MQKNANVFIFKGKQMDCSHLNDGFSTHRVDHLPQHEK